MQNKQSQKKKDPYTKPEVHTHEPLRNITANLSNNDPTIWR